jgi:hypothetical protein
MDCAWDMTPECVGGFASHIEDHKAGTAQILLKCFRVDQ